MTAHVSPDAPRPPVGIRDSGGPMPFNEADFTRDVRELVAEGDRVPEQRGGQGMEGDALTKPPQRPHHWMNADGTCHAGDMFEAGTPSMPLYTFEQMEAWVTAERQALLTQERMGSDRMTG